MGELDNMEVDFDSVDTPTEIPKTVKEVVEEASPVRNKATPSKKKFVNCLRNERVIVKFVHNEKGLISDPKHVLYGGLGENSKRRFVVPVLQSGVFKNVLTNSEKECLETIMGLPENALSVYRKVDNFWTNRGVTLGKEPTILDLSIPDDYIKYKILLANDDYIAPSEEALRNHRKATYQFVLHREGQELENALESLNTTSKAFMLFGELKNDLKKLAMVIEMTTGKTISRIEEKHVFAQVETAIKETPERFIKNAEDPFLDTKILIKDAISSGYIRKRGEYYYLTEGNRPLCNDKQEPTLQSACEFLNAPKNQEILFLLQGKVYG